ncbi:DUF6869 domain-containing protein [Parvularcula maris]|uniref:DUF6869 domain-containing protein n=1 Tax=Parvularcula maris TaxID=2965077 RepID=A0A9X2RH61_9PROT|nr:hypothetical protein [Parvularcula maris]MCQ8184514.1 hypothetical protein [Parvularcula maris]
MAFADRADQLATDWAAALDDRAPISDEVLRDAALVSFLTKPDVQWRFIRRCLEEARTDYTLVHIGAGPLEHLLAKEGAAFIGQVELLAANSERFGLALHGCARNKIEEEVWQRVLAARAAVEEPVWLDAIFRTSHDIRIEVEKLALAYLKEVRDRRRS